MPHTFYCPACGVTGPAHYSNCPNCGCDYLETTIGYGSSHYRSHDAYNEYDARNDGYPGWY